MVEIIYFVSFKIFNRNHLITLVNKTFFNILNKIKPFININFERIRVVAICFTSAYLNMKKILHNPSNTQENFAKDIQALKDNVVSIFCTGVIVYFIYFQALPRN